MAFGATSLLVGLALFALYIEQGEAIRCWVCSTDVDRSCGDPFNKTNSRYLLSDCERERSHTHYLKTTAVCRKFKHISNGVPVIVRSCTWGSDREDEGPCSASALPPNTRLEYCSTCDTDECNSANSLAASTLVSLFAALLVAKLLR